MIKSVYTVLESLKSTSSINEKKDILFSNKENNDLKLFFLYALHPNYKYGIKKIPEFISSNENVSFQEIIELIEQFRLRKLTGNKAINALSELLSKSSEENQYIIDCIISRKPRCGVNVALVNTIWENLIPDVAKLCKADAYSEKNIKHISFPAFSQRKCDGARCIAICNNGIVTLLTSSGLHYNCLTDLCNEIALFDTGNNYVLDGELLVEENNKVLPRKEGNGILNKSVHNTISEEEASKVRMVVWDYIPYEEYTSEIVSKTYEEVFLYMSEKFNNNTFSRISLVETKIVQNKQELIEHFRYMLMKGEEGVIVKSPEMKWENKRSKYQVKMKVIIQNTLKVIAINEGTEKYENNCGALVCESSDGKVVVKCSGLSDEERKEIWNNQEKYLGKFAEIESNGIIKADDGTYSLFLPRFVEFREDKTIADDLETIIALSDGSKMLV